MSIPGAVHYSVGTAGQPTGDVEAQILSASQNDFDPIRHRLAGTLAFQLSPTSTDRDITGFEALDKITQVSGAEGGHQFATKTVTYDGTAGDTGILRILHDDPGAVSALANHVLCPGDVSLVLGPNDAFRMVYWSGRWQVDSVTYAPQTPLSPANISADQSAWNPAGFARAVNIRIQAAAAANLHGMESAGSYTDSVDFLGAHLRKQIMNISTADITIKDESTTEGTARNRFSLAGGDFVLAPNASVDVFYDETSDRWRIVQPERYGDTVLSGTVNTTDATATTIATYTMGTNDRVASLRATVWGRRTGGTGGTANDAGMYVLEGLIDRVSGTVAEVGSATTIIAEDNASWGGASLSISSPDARIQVTGDADNNITWRCKLEVSEHG